MVEALDLPDHVVIERHEDAVVDHFRGLDDRDDSLFEALIVTVQLQLHDDTQSALAHSERLSERRHSLRGEPWCCAGTDVNRLELHGVSLPHLEGGSANLHQIAVVHDDHFAIGGLSPSNSMKSASCSTASRKAANVFSGAVADEPRCAITSTD